jgi:hypothetical protein
MREITEYVQYEAPEAGTTDAHGNATTAWADPIDVGIFEFDPGSTAEPREGQSRVIVEPTLYLPPGAVLAPAGRVTARGNKYQVEGETRQWHRHGEPIGNVATLRRVDG